MHIRSRLPKLLSRLLVAARSFAHRAFWAAAIFLRAADDMARLGAEPIFAIATTGCEFFRMLVHSE